MSKSTQLFTVRKPRRAAVSIITACFSLALAVALYYSTMDRASIAPVLLTLLCACLVSAVNLTCWYKSRRANAEEHRIILHRQERIRDDINDVRGDLKALTVAVAQLTDGQRGIAQAVRCLTAQLADLDQGTTDDVDWYARAEEFLTSIAPQPPNVRILRRRQ